MTVTDQVMERIDALRGLLADASDGESLKLHANVRAVLRNDRGEVIDEREMHNVICTAGKNLLLAASSAKTVDNFDYIAIGTGTTGALAGDTALETEAARAQGTTTNPSASTWQVTYTFPAGTGTGAITESGLDYQNSASGAILARQTFAAINKGAGDTLQMTWQIT